MNDRQLMTQVADITIPLLLFTGTVVVLFLALTSSAFAAERLIVVEDMGGASALPYYKRLNLNPHAPDIKDAKPLQGPITEAQMLPVISKKLSPGRVESRTANATGLMQPLFLVGADDLSLAWLKQRSAILKEIGAVGMVVNVSDANSLAALRKAADGLELLPACGDDIAGILGIENYPVLITRTGIEQ
jgi:integrating conjugative element protein (TIGR03765 family)